MDSKLLQRVMDLAEKTGDRVIVVNPKNGTAHAIMPFEAYEKLVANRASLRDLVGEWERLDDSGKTERDFCEDPEIALGGLDSGRSDEGSEEVETLSVEELNRLAAEAIDEEKKPKQSQKDKSDATPLDILDDTENEEQYYLEPLE